MSKQPTGVVTTIISAGTIEATGRIGQTGHQVRMDDGTYLHIQPDTAKQWIETLTPIAEQDNA